MDWINFWVHVFEVISTVSIAGIVAWIAYNQHKLDKDKHKLALYDRRLKVFKDVKRVLSQTVRTAVFPVNDCEDFWESRAQSDFIFDDDIKKYLEEIWEQGVRLHTYKNLLQAERDKEKRSEIVEKDSAVFEWFCNQLKTHPEKFKPYLKINDK